MKQQKTSPSRALSAFKEKLNISRKDGLLKKLGGIIKSESGFSIMEAIVAILLFTMLTTTAFSVIRTAMVITGNTMESATQSQRLVNALVSDSWEDDNSNDFDFPDGDVHDGEIIVFTFEGSAGTVIIEHSVEVFDGDDFFAFRPSDNSSD